MQYNRLNFASAVIALCVGVTLGTAASQGRVEAGSGCCSWHGGQAYCGSSGKWMCNDGTESPTCTCTGAGTSGIDTTTSSKKTVVCQPGEVRIEDSCYDSINACIRQHGPDATTIDGLCKCKDGYEMKDGFCEFIDTSTRTGDERLRRIQSRIQPRSSSIASSSRSSSKSSSSSRITKVPSSSTSSYSRRTVTSSSRSSNFPLDLLRNQEWKIKITAPFDDILGQSVFEVERKDDRFTVTPYKIDGRTGKLTGDGDSYWASYDSNYDSPSDMYLEIQTCWYKYENIREGFICHFYRIPSVIKGATVLGFNDYSFTISSTPSDTFQVSVTSKSTRESTCDVKAETYEGQKVYYPKSSTYYEDTTRDFRCFDSEDQAKKAGYKASVR